MKEFFLYYLNIRKKPYIILIGSLWMISIVTMQSLFKAKTEDIYQTQSINAADRETTPLLHPQDTVQQTFVLGDNHLSNIKLAFHYDADMLSNTTLMLQVFHEDTLVVEQPLPLQACPLDEFLTLQTSLDGCKGEHLTIRITNTSSDSDAVFSVLSTTRYYTYKDYTEEYFHNDDSQIGSMLCSFEYMVGHNYYPAVTSVFYVAIVTIILSGLIFKGCSWLQQRKTR